MLSQLRAIPAAKLNNSRSRLGRLRTRTFATIKNFMRRPSFLSDAYWYHYVFFRKTTACRGVFRSFEEARAAGARIARVGYGDDVLVPPEGMGETTHIRRRDYPILFWLAPVFRSGLKILNLGANIGSEFFTYRQFIDFPNHLQWTVWELPQIVRFAKKLTETIEAPGLTFTSEIDHADADVIITCGAMQYFEHDLATYLREMRKLPTHLFVNRIPAYEGETFFTLQNVVNSVVPYRIHGREQLVRSLLQLGYHLVDSWYEDHDINIPFHPERHVTRFYGFYFCADKAWKAGWRNHAVATSKKLQVLLSRNGDSAD